MVGASIAQETPTGTPLASGRNKGRNHMIYELRIYHCVSGRLPALLKRFETITLGIWERNVPVSVEIGE